MKKSILFDMDGTVVVSHTGIISSLQYTIDKLDIEELKGRDLLCFVGPPLKTSFMEIAHLDDVRADEAVTAFREHYSQYGLFDSKLFDGMKDMLYSLKDKANLYICTSKPTPFAKSLCDYFSIAECFVGIFGSNLNERTLPKSETIKDILLHQHIKNEDALMVGDKFQDVDAARINSIRSVGVTYGYGSREELLEGAATKIVGSVNELGKLLEKFVCKEQL